METIQTVLLAQRTTDGKFLKLDEQRFTTGYEFIDKPELAKRIHPYCELDLLHIQDASYYFENSYRAREYWTKDCVMVPYKITTKTIAVPISTDQGNKG